MALTPCPHWRGRWPSLTWPHRIQIRRGRVGKPGDLMVERCRGGWRAAAFGRQHEMPCDTVEHAKQHAVTLWARRMLADPAEPAAVRALTRGRDVNSRLLHASLKAARIGDVGWSDLDDAWTR